MQPCAIDVQKITLSTVKDGRSTQTHTITLPEVMEAITGPRYAPTVEEIRRLTAEGKHARRKALKLTLPAVMFAGTFTHRRNDALLHHSGLLVLDFDDCDVTLKARLAADPHAVLCFLSPSGTGLKLVIRIEPDPAHHGASFDAACRYFSERYGLLADPSGRELARLCFLSHDPDAVLVDAPSLLHRPHMTTETTHDYASDEGDTPPPDGDEGDAHTPTAGLCSLYGLCNIEDVLRVTQPTQPGQRHRQVFALARGLRFECKLADAPMPDLKRIVRRWYDMALPNIGTQDFTETWSDFIHCWERVKTPLLSNAVASAWEATLAGDLPAAANDYDRAEVRQLIGLCWQLAHRAETFYLSMHRAAGLLAVQPMQVCRWLKMLQADGILELVKTGTKHTASTYRWRSAENGEATS